MREARSLPPGSPRRRRLLLFGGLMVWSGLVVAQLWQLQIERHEEWVEKANKQQEWTVRIAAPRGTIYDSRGRELAVSVDVESAYADPREIENPADVAAALGKALGLGRTQLQRLERNLASVERTGVVVARRLEPEIAARVRELDLPGVYFQRESKRYYPKGSLAANVIGIAGIDHQGLEGLEVYFNSVVAGRDVERTVIKHPGRGYVLDPDAMAALAEPGADLYLTLDATLQFLAERELARAIEEVNAKSGSVVILDPRDSAILAMASWPTFDPNRIEGTRREERKNLAVSDAYEPGSTFKVLTAASVLENMVLYPDDRIDCERGGLQVDKAYIRDHKPFDVLTFREVIAKSSNVGVMKAALRLGGDRFLDTLEDFHLGEKTGVDLPGENAGGIRFRSEWQRNDMVAYASFGQGINVTPLQMANAVAAIANGGRLHRPYIVSHIGKNGQRQPANDQALGRESRWGPGELIGRPISPATAQTVMRMMEGVVVEGTGKAAAIAGYRVGGKTGTAQVSDSSGYSRTRRVASFVGVAPAREPRLVVLVAIKDPVGRTHGGDVAAPVFRKIVSEALVYLGIAPQPDPLEASVAWIPLEPREVEPVRVTEMSPSRVPIGGSR